MIINIKNVKKLKAQIETKPADQVKRYLNFHERGSDLIPSNLFGHAFAVIPPFEENITGLLKAGSVGHTKVIARFANFLGIPFADASELINYHHEYHPPEDLPHTDQADYIALLDAMIARGEYVSWADLAAMSDEEKRVAPKYYVAIDRSAGAIFEISPNSVVDESDFIAGINEALRLASNDADSFLPLEFFKTLKSSTLRPNEGFSIYLVGQNAVDRPDGTFKDWEHPDVYNAVTDGPDSTLIGFAA